MFNIRSLISPQTVLSRTSYDYAPSVLFENGTFKMWWCAGQAGDFIGYAEAADLQTGFQPVLSSFFANRSNGRPQTELAYSSFDGIHACDPSVVRVDNTYYLYYGGLASHRRVEQINDRDVRLSDYPQPDSVATTHIGIAVSSNGQSWQRLNQGEPILRPYANPFNKLAYSNYPSLYGAGQPSVVYVNARFYLIYHDSTGQGRNPVNGAGIYALSSPDPLFQADVSELRCNGDEQDIIRAGTCTDPYWKLLPPKTRPSTRYAVQEGFSSSLAYTDRLNQFLIATHRQQGSTQISFFDLEFRAIPAPNANQLRIPSGEWRDGPGLLTNPQGHLLESATDPTCEMPIDIFSGVGAARQPNSWEIAHWGADLDLPCTQGAFELPEPALAGLGLIGCLLIWRAVKLVGQI